jgi:hypothetical protein
VEGENLMGFVEQFNIIVPERSKVNISITCVDLINLWSRYDHYGLTFLRIPFNKSVFIESNPGSNKNNNNSHPEHKIFTLVNSAALIL